MESLIGRDETIVKLEKIELLSDSSERDLIRRLDKCSGHCISGDEGTMGHHDNREPLY